MRRFFKQFIYGFLYLSILAVIVGGVYYFYFIPEQSCFDDIKNQNETGLDCGGTCADCELKTLTLKIDEPQAFDGGQFKSTLLARVTNPSLNYGLNDFEYEFQVFSQFGTLISKFRARSYILTDESKYLIVPGIDIDPRDISHVTINIPIQNWERGSNLPHLNLKFKDLLTLPVAKSVQVGGVLVNDSSSGFSSVSLIGILFDKNGDTVNASGTKIDNVRAFSEIPFTIFYPIIKNVQEINFGSTKVFYEVKR